MTREVARDRPRRLAEVNDRTVLEVDRERVGGAADDDHCAIQFARLCECVLGLLVLVLAAELEDLSTLRVEQRSRGVVVGETSIEFVGAPKHLLRCLPALYGVNPCANLRVALPIDCLNQNGAAAFDSAKVNVLSLAEHHGQVGQILSQPPQWERVRGKRVDFRRYSSVILRFADRRGGLIFATVCSVLPIFSDRAHLSITPGV